MNRERLYENLVAQRPEDFTETHIAIECDILALFDGSSELYGLIEAMVAGMGLVHEPCKDVFQRDRNGMLWVDVASPKYPALTVASIGIKEARLTICGTVHDDGAVRYDEKGTFDIHDPTSIPKFKACLKERIKAKSCWFE